MRMLRLRVQSLVLVREPTGVHIHDGPPMFGAQDPNSPWAAPVAAMPTRRIVFTNTRYIARVPDGQKR
jgi:hypothetical protein